VARAAETQTASLVPQSNPTVRPVPQANASANDIINERGYWSGLIEPDRPTPPADIPNARVASAENPITGSVAQPWPMPERRSTTNSGAMAYAPANQPADETVEVQGGSAAKARHIGKAPAAKTTPSNTGSRTTAKRPARVAKAKIGERYNNPWLRAMIVAPNALDFMSTSLYGAPDVVSIREHMQKPAASVMMTFSQDPYLGMTADQFRGNAVVFVATVTFRQRTAALQ
jgi:hypothetical protein